MWSNPNVIENQGSGLREILSRIDISPDEVLNLLSQDGFGHDPEWDACQTRFDEYVNLEADPIDEPYTMAISGFMGPIIQNGLRFIRELLEETTARKRIKIGDISTLSRSMVDALVQRLGGVFEKILVLEFNVERDRSVREGRPGPSIQHFMKATGDRNARKDITREYPVLVRCVVDTVSSWRSYCATMLRRIEDDCDAVVALIEHDLADSDLKLTGIALGKGDTHNGEAVAVLEIDRVHKIVYKPHSLAIDSAFSFFVNQIQQRRGRLAMDLFLPRSLDRGEYGWQEYVSNEPVESKRESQRFYRRHGQLLALFYLLGATDIHEENIIAHGEYPVPIDLETLFCASSSDSLLGPFGSDTSILSIGLLPQAIRGENSDKEVILSGIGVPGRSRLSPNPNPTISFDKTGEIRVEKQRVQLPEKENQLVLDGSIVSPTDFLSHIEDGFRSAYAALGELLAEFPMEDVVAPFLNKTVRFVPRATHIYAQALSHSYHPDFLRSGLDREIYLLHLLDSDSNLRDFSTKFFLCEIDQLLMGDVPYFYTTPESTSVFSMDGTEFADVLDLSGIELFRQRAALFGEGHLERLIWFIRAAIKSIAPVERLVFGEGSLEAASAVEHIRSGSLTAQAIATIQAKSRRIIFDLVRWRDGVPEWPTLELQNERHWGISFVGSDLYYGSAGISVYLSSIDDASNADLTALLAGLDNKHLASMRAWMASDRRVIGQLDKELAGFGEISSSLYALVCSARRTGDTEKLREASDIFLHLLHQNKLPAATDFIGGLAGTLRVVSAVYQSSKDPNLLNLIEEIALEIVSRAKVSREGMTYWVPDIPSTAPLLGLSHGTSGIAMSLGTAGALCSSPQIIDLVAQALKYEDANYSVAISNWPDRRDIGEPRGMHAWCHGSVGILLSRLVIERDSGLREACANGIALASSAVAERFTNRQLQWMGNDSVCHGNMGIVATMTTALRARPASQYAEPFRNWIDFTLRNLGEPGRNWSAGPPGIELPGMMIGVSGVGAAANWLAHTPSGVPEFMVLG